MPPAASSRLGVGLVGLGLLLVALVRWLRGQTAGQYAASQDPVAGTEFAVTLVVFALMPRLGHRK